MRSRHIRPLSPVWSLCRGVDEGGALGFLKGALRGALGLLVRPLDSLLATCAGMADSIRTLIMGPPAIAPRVRPPRYVPPTGPLTPYDLSEVCASDWNYLKVEVAQDLQCCQSEGSTCLLSVRSARRCLYGCMYWLAYSWACICPELP